MLAIGLLYAVYAHAQTPTIYGQVYDNQETLFNTPGYTEEAFRAVDAYRAAANKAKSAKSNYGGSCVQFAKNYLHVYGVWGNGGHYLSLNSGPVVGAVVIFQGTHVAVITAIDGDSITIIESNYDLHGHIRTRTLPASSATIKGFHIFS